MDRDARAYLWDVQMAAESIGRFIDGLDAASYAQNALITAAVERKFEIIGEALNQLSSFRRTSHNVFRISEKSLGFAIFWSMGMR